MTTDRPSRSDPRVPPGDPLGLLGRPHRPVLATALSLLVAVGLILTATATVLSRIHDNRLDAIEQELTSDVDVTIELLDAWSREHRRTAAIWAADPDVVAAAEQLLDTNHSHDTLLARSEQYELRDLLRPVIEAREYQGFFVVAPDDHSVASTRDENTGITNLAAARQPGRMRQVFNGETVLTIPQISDVPLPGPGGEVVSGLPTMFSAAPIRSADGTVVGALMFRLDVLRSFNQIFTQSRSEQVGEVIAFDELGRLLVPSAYAADLRDASLIGTSSFDLLPIRDPGGSLDAVDPDERRRWPLTRMAAAATDGEEGSDVAGYRSYHGREVFGAWRWSDELGFGIASEAPTTDLLSSWAYVRNSILGLAGTTVALVVGLGWYLGLSRPRLVWNSRATAERARRFREVIDQSSNGMLLIGSDGLVILANRAMASMFRYEVDALVGKRVDRLVDPLHRSSHPANVASFLEGSTPGGPMAPHVRTVLARRRDKTLFPVEVTLSRIDLDHERIVLVSIRDLTTDVRAIELDQALRELERLTTVAAHDLNEPLRKVETLSDLLAASLEPTEEQAHTVERLQAATARMRSLTEDLMRYIEWSTRAQHPAPVDLNEVVAEVLIELRSQAPDGADVDIQVSALPVVWGDRDQLTELFRQLLDNSLKFSGDRAMVTLWSDGTASHDMHTIVLRDNGIGFPAEYSDRVFDAFRTLRPGDGGDLWGNGIGLAISRRIVERHQGKIRAESAAGQGTTITIQFPRPRPADDAQPGEPADGELTGGRAG